MTKIAIVNFGSGEISPEVDARKDIEKYSGGCRKLENMIPDLYGNAVKRPGTELITIGGKGCYYLPVIPDPAKIGISTMEELALIGNDDDFPMDGDYELLNALDATGITFWPIGINSDTGVSTTFTGTFNGNFYTISNILFDTDVTAAFNSQKFGLFTSATGATIENLTISNMTIVGPPNPGPSPQNFGAGLLVAQALNPTVITNCHTQGTITSTGRLIIVGGLTGQTNASLNICSANVDISCSGEFIFVGGGLAGSGGGLNMANCYAQGSITYTGIGATALREVGGLLGSWGGISSTDNCYSAVTISGVVSTDVAGFVGNDLGAPVYTSNYWDNDLIETPPAPLDDTGNAGDVAGILKSATAAMQSQQIYIGWDFDTIWQIDDGNDYPRFQWQSLADIKQVCIPL